MSSSNVTDIDSKRPSLFKRLSNAVKQFFNNAWNQFKEFCSKLNDSALLTLCVMSVMVMAMLNELVFGIVIWLVIMCSPILMVWVMLNKLEMQHAK